MMTIISQILSLNFDTIILSPVAIWIILVVDYTNQMQTNTQCSILCVRQCFMCLCSDIVIYWKW